MECNDITGVYKRRKPQETSLWKLKRRFITPSLIANTFFPSLKYCAGISFTTANCWEKSASVLQRVCRSSSSLTLGKKLGIPGIVVTIQTFGDYARWHPHLHALVADGLFLDSGYFYVMPKVDLRPLRELFRAHMLKMLKKEGLIDDTFIQMILRWRHTSGFNVHNEVRIKPEDEKGV